MIRAAQPFRLTIVHPCVGRSRTMKRYIRTWQMEPLPSAMIAALVPPDIERRFYDDRLEAIPYDEPTNLVAISVETYTAKRAYQIASEYRRRGVPVVMGGFHATLCPEEVAEYAESVVIGEGEEVIGHVIDDYRHRRPEKTYRACARPSLTIAPDRSIFDDKRYLPLRLVEFARGCRFQCDFCAIQSFYGATHQHRSVRMVIDELRRVGRRGHMIFFIDDNFTSGLEEAKQLMRELVPLKIRWITQTAINVAHDDEALELMKRSGCQGVLMGFESLNPDSLQAMNKEINLARGGPAAAADNLRRHGLAVYGTFVFGYDQDTEESIGETVRFARQQGLFLAGFNHVTPFPGTPLYQRLQQQGRMLFDKWWMDERYRYNMIPFRPRGIDAQRLAHCCLQARRQFYSWPSMLSRLRTPVNRSSLIVLRDFLAINAMHQRDVESRTGMPLGDETWNGSLLKAQ